MAGKLMTDEAVIKLLQEDAKNASSGFRSQGLGAYLPRRATGAAPKTNTRFLRNLIRETDSHNQALLAKEAEEAQAKFREHRRKEEKQSREEERERRREREDSEDRHRAKRRRVDLVDRDSNRLSPPRESKRYREEKSSSQRRSRSPERRRDRSPSRSLDHKRRRHHDGDTASEDDRARRKETLRKGAHMEGDRSRDRSRREKNRSDHKRRHRSRERSRDRRKRMRSYSRSNPSDDECHTSRRRDRHHKARPSHSRSSERSRSRSPRHDGMHKTESKSNVPNGRIKTRLPSPPTSSAANGHDGHDSDPLEDIVGPLPPPPAPKVRVRGRGAMAAAANAIDNRFSSTYDPTTDVTLDIDEEDDWGQALEALQARAKFKRTQGERLRAAGFTDEEVKSWEKGGEKNEGDVRWSQKGEGREWDRGKVVDDEGMLAGDNEYGRLK